MLWFLPSCRFWVISSFATGFISHRGCLLVLAISAGMIHNYQYNQMLPANHLVHYLEQYPVEKLNQITLSATMVTPSVLRQPIKTFPYHSQPNLQTRFWVDADELTAFGRSVPVTGLVEVSISGLVDQYQPGMRLRLSGHVSRIQTSSPAIPYIKPFTYYTDNLIFVKLSVDDSEHATILSETVTFPSLTDRLQRWVRHSLLGDGLPVGEYTNDLLSAVVLGKQNTTENILNQAMVHIGATHFLAVSGFNIFVLAFGIWWLSTLIGLGKQYAALLVIACTLAYAVMTDFGPSVTRATIMTVAFCGGAVLNPTDPCSKCSRPCRWCDSPD